MTEKITKAQIAQAVAALQNPNSYSAVYRSLTQPREFTQPREAVDLGTVAEIRQRAAEEEQPPAIDLPSFSSGGGGGGDSAPPPASVPPAQARPAARALSLEEQARLLQQQLDAQHAAYSAAPSAVSSALARDEQPYRYMGDV